MKNLDEVTKFEDFNLHESFRAHMIYEEIVKEQFKPNSIKNVLLYFYANVMACNRELDADFDQFLDWLDTKPTMVEEFTNWIIDNVKRKVVKDTDGGEASDKEPFHD